MTEPRWRIALLLSAAIAISYLDRQALSVAVAAIQRDIPLTNIAVLAAPGRHFSWPTR